MTRDEMIERFIVKLLDRIRMWSDGDEFDKGIIAKLEAEWAALRAPAVTGEARDAVVAELRAIAAWMNQPGNIWREDAIDECRRVLANRAHALEHEAAPLQPFAAPPAAGAPPAEGSPLPLEHTRSCGALTGRDCTCGLAWRIRLVTEQEMHAAWRKRAEEAEAREAGAPPALVALVQRQAELLGQCEAFIAEQFDADDGDAVALSNSIYAIRKTLESAVRHGSPAPAPVAPPAETRPVGACAAHNVLACEVCLTDEAFAPPAVAGGDAPPFVIEGDRVVYGRAEHSEWVPGPLTAQAHNDNPDNIRSIERNGVVIWRRRQEAQS